MFCIFQIKQNTLTAVTQKINKSRKSFSFRYFASASIIGDSAECPLNADISLLYLDLYVLGDDALIS